MYDCDILGERETGVQATTGSTNKRKRKDRHRRTRRRALPTPKQGKEVRSVTPKDPKRGPRREWRAKVEARKTQGKDLEKIERKRKQ